MSFGYSAGDFIAIGQLAWSVYKSCKGAPGEFQELARELSSLHTILHELEDEAKTPKSLLNRRGVGRKPELEALLENLSTTISKVDDIVKRYHSLGRDQKKTWDRVKFATKDLADLRSKLQLHITGINLFISSLSAGSLARIEGLLDELVRDIREGRKEPTIVSTYEDSDELAWDELERELVGDGITREDVRCYREEIREYLRRLVGDDTDTIGPFDSVSCDEDLGQSTPNHDEPASHEESSSDSDEKSAAWQPIIMANEDPDHGPSDQDETVPKTVPHEVSISDSDEEPATSHSIMMANDYPSHSTSVDDETIPKTIPRGKSSSDPNDSPVVIVDEMLAARLTGSSPIDIDLSDLTLTERQTLFSIATTPRETFERLGIPYPNLAIVTRAQNLARELAFREQTFYYQAFEKLGSALPSGFEKTVKGFERLSLNGYFDFLLAGNVFEIPVYHVSHIPRIPKMITKALEGSKIEYIEIPSGYRCGSPRTEFFVLIRRVRLLLNHTVLLFLDMAQHPFQGTEKDLIIKCLKEARMSKKSTPTLRDRSGFHY